jgi:hypothetical protein
VKEGGTGRDTTSLTEDGAEVRGGARCSIHDRSNIPTKPPSKGEKAHAIKVKRDDVIRGEQYRQVSKKERSQDVNVGWRGERPNLLRYSTSMQPPKGRRCGPCQCCEEELTDREPGRPCEALPSHHDYQVGG